MSYAKIVITQDSVSGASGVARDDIEAYSVASKAVTLSNDATGDLGVSSWEWTLLEQPPGSAISMLNPTSQNAELRPDVPGRYVVSLRVNGLGDSTSGYARTVIGVKYDALDGAWGEWLPPAATEGFDANWSANAYGAQPALYEIIDDLHNALTAGYTGAFEFEALTLTFENGILTGVTSVED